MTKIIRLFVVTVFVSLGFASAVAETPPSRPASTLAVSDEALENYYSEQNFAQCESSPGGTAIVPREQLLQLAQPAGGSTSGRPVQQGRGSR